MKTLILVVLAALLIGCAENPIEVQPIDSNSRAWQYLDANHEAIYVDISKTTKLVIVELVYDNGETIRMFLQSTGYPVLTINLPKKDVLKEVRFVSAHVEKWQWVRGSEIDTLSVLDSVGYSSRYLGAIKVIRVPEEMLLYANWYNAPQLAKDYSYSLRNDGTFMDPCNHDGLKRVE